MWPSTGSQCIQRLGCANVGHAAATWSYTATVKATKSATRLWSTPPIPPTNRATKPDRSARAAGTQWCTEWSTIDTDTPWRCQLPAACARTCSCKNSKRRTRNRSFTRTKGMAAQRATRAVSSGSMMGVTAYGDRPTASWTASATSSSAPKNAMRSTVAASKRTSALLSATTTACSWMPQTQVTTSVDTSRGDRTRTLAGDGNGIEEEAAATCSAHSWRSNMGVVPPPSPSSRRLPVATTRNTRTINRPGVSTSTRAASGNAHGSRSLAPTAPPRPPDIKCPEARQWGRRLSSDVASSPRTA